MGGDKTFAQLCIVYVSDIRVYQSCSSKRLNVFPRDDVGFCRCKR